VRIWKCEAEDGMRAGKGNKQPCDSADAAQQYTLGQNLADDATASRTEGHAQRNIRAMHGAAREQKIRNVRTGNNQNHR
jgi:hypothetical protein